jgi:hypothetical protein
MPWKIRKNNDGSFSVVNRVDGTVKAKHSTWKKAKAQTVTLHAQEYGWQPRGKGIRRRRRG